MLPKFPGADCANCPGKDLPAVPFESSSSPKRLTIIGERPGTTEFEKGRPFTGASGRLLMKGIKFLQLTRDDVHWTNAVPCAVKDKDLPKARKCCEKRLRAEIDIAASPVIMPVGAYGCRSVMKLKTAQIMAYRGTVSAQVQDELGVWRLSTGGLVAAGGRPIRYVCPTIHPAAALRQPLLMPLLRFDVERIARVMANGWSAPERLENRRFVYARTVDQLHDGLHAMSGADTIGADVETVGLGPTETSLVCLALSSGPVTTIIPWARASNGRKQWWQQPSAIARDVSGFLERRVAVTHNGPAFDHIVMGRYGLHIQQWDDTLQASHVIESHLPKGLARVASSWLDVGPWKTWEHSKKLTHLWTYNGRDTLYTVLAWQKMKGLVT